MGLRQPIVGQQKPLLVDPTLSGALVEFIVDAIDQGLPAGFDDIFGDPYGSPFGMMVAGFH